MRTYEVTLADLPGQTAAVVRGHVTLDQIGAFVGAAFGEVMAAIGRTGQQPAGMPFARYHRSGDGFDVEAGFPIRAAVPAQGRVETVTLPGGHAAKVMHQGAYDQVGAAYDAGMRWITENGFRLSGDPWEVYLDEPTVPEPRTQVFMPCVEAHR